MFPPFCDDNDGDALPGPHFDDVIPSVPGEEQLSSLVDDCLERLAAGEGEMEEDDDRRPRPMDREAGGTAAGRAYYQNVDGDIEDIDDDGIINLCRPSE